MTPAGNRQRIRVLHVVQNLNYGGMERLIADMARRGDLARFDVHIMALGYLGHFSQGLEGAATLHLARQQPRWSMLRPATLASDIGRVAPDVVHLHSGVWYKASLAARMAGVSRVVYTDHGRQHPDPWTYRTLDRVASRRTDVTVAVSEPLSEQLRHIVHDARRIRVIRNGVDTDAYAPVRDDGELRHELGIAPEVPVLGSVGRLERIKGYDVMVDAFAALVRDWPVGEPGAAGPQRPHLVLVGDGSERAVLEQQATALGVRDAVHFLGWRSDIHRCHRAFTLFTMSSRSEGTSVSLLEAMSAGLCPVITDVGGNRGVVGDALAHRLVESESPKRLAAAWRDALTDVPRRNQDAVMARARVCATFSLDAMVQAYEALYEALYESLSESRP